MFLKPRKTSTDPRLRSLLQKAARRGFSRIVRRTAELLDAIGDKSWLRSRAIVITFEECWPLAASLSIDHELSSKISALLRVTTAAKQKEAAGLGALAYAYKEGDRSMLEQVPDQRALRIVAEALERPNDFFEWVSRESRSRSSADVVHAAQRYLAAATWQWDKACILAGALLSASPNPPAIETVSGVEEEFPYWVALDKHTDEGKIALQNVAREVKTSYRQLIWASFYCESAYVNKLLASPWFDSERIWRFKRAGLSPESAEALWANAGPLVRDQLESKALSLRNLVESSSLHPPLPHQSSLL